MADYLTLAGCALCGLLVAAIGLSDPVADAVATLAIAAAALLGGL